MGNPRTNRMWVLEARGPYCRRWCRKYHWGPIKGNVHSTRREAREDIKALKQLGWHDLHIRQYICESAEQLFDRE